MEMVRPSAPAAFSPRPEPSESSPSRAEKGRMRTSLSTIRISRSCGVGKGSKAQKSRPSPLAMRPDPSPSSTPASSSPGAGSSGSLRRSMVPELVTVAPSRVRAPSLTRLRVGGSPVAGSTEHSLEMLPVTTIVLAPWRASPTQSPTSSPAMSIAPEARRVRSPDTALVSPAGTTKSATSTVPESPEAPPPPSLPQAVTSRPRTARTGIG